MTTALFIGRFQPLHNGHISAIGQIKKDCDSIKICIGSAQEAGTRKNPFSFEERKKMLESSLPEGTKIFPLPDMHDNEKWLDSAEKVAGKFDFVITGNALVKKLFSGRGYKILEVKKLSGVSATRIRRLIISGGDWKSLVPPAVAIIVEDVGGVERIKKLG